MSERKRESRKASEKVKRKDKVIKSDVVQILSQEKEEENGKYEGNKTGME